jgi:hypothetical protein
LASQLRYPRHFLLFGYATEIIGRRRRILAAAAVEALDAALAQAELTASVVDREASSLQQGGESVKTTIRS